LAQYLDREEELAAVVGAVVELQLCSLHHLRLSYDWDSSSEKWKTATAL
jgi:hypothetical protein